MLLVLRCNLIRSLGIPIYHHGLPCRWEWIVTVMVDHVGEGGIMVALEESEIVTMAD
jgi:hypothetical protein